MTFAPETLASITSVKGSLIRLTYRQWVHITESHDYMIGNREMVLETIADPDQLPQGNSGETIALRHYPRTNITEKTSIAIYSA